PDALTEGEWGFEHTKTIFINEIIPFLKSLKDIFNVFDKDLLNEITEVQTVFNQIEAVVQQCSVDKQCFEIVKKELFLENDRLLQKIMSQDVLLSVMNSITLNGESVNVEMQRSESCDKCFNLDAELSKTQNAYNDLLKSYSQLEKHCISLELSIQLNQEIFQKDKSCDNQNALEIPEYFEYNDLKAQIQDKVVRDIVPLVSGPSSFGNDQILKIMGYGDYQLGNVIISRVYYVEGPGHNLFSVGQFYDVDLEVAFRKNTCFIQNLEGVDLLLGSRDTISLDDMLKTSSIYLLSKASKTKSWLWHRRLSHLNFARKSSLSSQPHKAEDTNQEKLYLLHMDLCDMMRMKSINGKKYILVIVDDYSRFTWVRFLRSKDEAPYAIIKCIKYIQVRLNATVRNVRIDNGTEFVNQTLRDFYENFGISL
ncbi:retrovirus-related pol polyprotein from transposon TNT 1-94, partial [Tanacetum coccineum]